MAISANTLVVFDIERQNLAR